MISIKWVSKRQKELDDREEKLDDKEADLKKKELDLQIKDKQEVLSILDTAIDARHRGIKDIDSLYENCIK